MIAGAENDLKFALLAEAAERVEKKNQQVLSQFGGAERAVALIGENAEQHKNKVKVASELQYQIDARFKDGLDADIMLSECSEDELNVLKTGLAYVGIIGTDELKSRVLSRVGADADAAFDEHVIEADLTEQLFRQIGKLQAERVKD